MKKSVLQQARSNYQPKMPKVFEGNVKVVEGAPTQSVADCDDIRRLFPNTYGLPEITFEVSESTDRTPGKAINVGVILSGGQAPGGHNVISGLYDGIIGFALTACLSPNAICPRVASISAIILSVTLPAAYSTGL